MDRMDLVDREATQLARAAAFIDAAIAAGKPIISIRSQLIDLYLQEPLKVSLLVEQLPSTGKARATAAEACGDGCVDR